MTCTFNTLDFVEKKENPIETKEVLLFFVEKKEHPIE